MPCRNGLNHRREYTLIPSLHHRRENYRAVNKAPLYGEAHLFVLFSGLAPGVMLLFEYSCIYFLVPGKSLLKDLCEADCKIEI